MNNRHDEWINVDLFAGGGGASTGMEWALGNSMAVPVMRWIGERIARHA